MTEDYRTACAGVVYTRSAAAWTARGRPPCHTLSIPRSSRFRPGFDADGFDIAVESVQGTVRPSCGSTTVALPARSA
jgi:hypothetical protein